ncbi:MAG: tRNA pseudouridine(38-40) synthase TruA [Clostridia bacterium]|nr:tRNA pseudouridine(38-40) synthase TruA [Clostridia bacterium]
MRNLLLELAYNGKAYHGWQVQENAPTVQQTFQDAWEQITGTRDNVTGCSRTDTGVHANMFCCNIRTETPLDCEKLITALNAVLPEDIAVRKCIEVPFEFHARYDCVSKEYIYRILNSPVPSPFLNGLVWQYKYPLDEKLLDRCAKHFLGKHDFSAFCSAGSSVEDTVRTVKNAQVSRQGNEVVFTIEADGFLYNMVRIITGTLIAVSQGKIKEEDIPSIIESKDRSLAGPTAPPHGLYLNKVSYGGEIR